MPPRKRGRPPKKPRPIGEDEKMTHKLIVQRYRERMIASGKQQINLWIDERLINKVKEIAADKETATSTVVEEILNKYFY
jgi:hypothetical protein